MKPNHEPNSLTRISRSRFITAIGLAALMTLPALAQDKEKDKHKDHPKDEKKGAQSGQSNEADMMAMMMEMAKPGENHKMLSQAVGQWTYKVKAWMSPDPNTPPQESSGTSVTREVMGGRYYITDHSGKFQMPGGPDGKMMDMEFKGMAVDGYDNVKKKFVASWIDNTGTGIMALQGDYDPASKSLTYHGEYEMMPGTKTKVREVIKLIDKDHRVFEWYEDRGGSEAKMMEITYTRKS